MIGVYDYTVILTYLSIVSGATGIIMTMTGIGHPFFGAVFLMLSGLCDAFDGMVARTKKGRTELEKKFGVQIDSLADLISFGVLPAAIGAALLRLSGRFTEIARHSYELGDQHVVKTVIMIGISVLYILTALVRLAYFNASEDMRKKEAEEKGREYFTGLPVTSAALIFPMVVIVDHFIRFDLTVFYYCVMLCVALLFVCKFKIPKLKIKGIMVLIGIGIIEFISMILIFCGR